MGQGQRRVDKCVRGTYTNVISGAVTYGSTKILRLVCSGNSVSAYYDGTQVGSTVTVSDAGIGATRGTAVLDLCQQQFCGIRCGIAPGDNPPYQSKLDLFDDNATERLTTMAYRTKK